MKKIISIEFKLPGKGIKAHDFYSCQSLLDGDIIVFDPDISGYYSVESYNGKPLLSEKSSFELQESTNRWRRELHIALEAGKSVFWFLRAKQEVFVYTGRKDFSGSGRSRVTTKIVDSITNYGCLPVSLGAIEAARGSAIIQNGHLGVLAGYWSDFAQHSSYECYIDGFMKGTKLMTKTGKKTVGGIFQVGQGWFVVLPPLKLGGTGFAQKKKGTTTSSGMAHKLIEHFISIDEGLRKSADRTPPPAWINNEGYKIEASRSIERNLEDINEEISKLESRRTVVLSDLDKSKVHLNLLYEQGHALESAVLESLRILGFAANSYKVADSEFDAIFESPEGRMLGEFEGKDNSAINIDKLSQLERNIQEDFQRAEIQEHAKGVLFGNAYRLAPVETRPQFFTEKCCKGATRARIALVRTPDFFPLVQYLLENPQNEDFKKRCRMALITTEGEIVVFPPIPESLPSGTQ